MAKRAKTSTKKTPRKATARNSTQSAPRDTLERDGKIKRRLAELERQQRITSYDAKLAAWSAQATPRTRGLAAAARDTRPPLRIIAEGDSWFDYPLEGRPFRSGDVIERLSDLIPFPILNLALRGDEARAMLGVDQRRKLHQLLEDPRRDFNVLLFSAGGNDIAGGTFRLWIRDRSAAGGDPARALNDAAFGSVLQIVRTAYEDLLDLRDAVVARTPNRRISVFLHEYDWALPHGNGVCGFGPWLKPSLEDRGWDDRVEATAIVKEALTRFANLLQDISRQYPDVAVVRTQGVLAQNEWHNELHPNRRGFPKIAQKFRDALRDAFPGHIP